LATASGRSANSSAISAADLSRCSGREPAAVLLDHEPALRDAGQHVVGGVHVDVEEVDVVGGDQRDVVGVGEVEQAGLDLGLASSSWREIST
jgi:hypothetical protein